MGVGVVPLGVGDGGGFEVVVMVAYWYMWWPHGRGGGLLLAAGTPWWWQCAVGGGASESRVMLNYFITINSHIIDLFMVGGVMQYSFEIDVVPLLVGVVSLGVGDGGGFVMVVAYWYMWWPHGRRGGPLLSVGTPWWWECALDGGASESRVCSTISSSNLTL